MEILKDVRKDLEKVIKNKNDYIEQKEKEIVKINFDWEQKYQTLKNTLEFDLQNKEKEIIAKIRNVYNINEEDLDFR